jgi:hypothetical protein
MAQFYNNLNQTMAIYFPTAVEYKAETSVSIRRLEVKLNIYFTDTNR